MNKSMIPLFSFCAFLFMALSVLLYRNAPSQEAHFDKDSYGYNAIAEHFAQTGQLTSPQSTEMPVQTIGYPLFIGSIYKLFGTGTYVVVIAQVLLSIVAGFFIMSTTAILFGSCAASLSALLWSVNLGFLIFSQFIMTDILLVTLLLGSIYMFLGYMLHSNIKRLIGSALFAGCSVAVKPVALLYVLGLCLSIIIWKKNSVFRNGQLVMLFSCVFMLPVLCYMTFNKITHNTFSVSSLVNENIYVYFLSKLNVHTQHISYEKAMQDIVATTKEYPRTDARRWKAARNQFWNHVRTNPALVVKVWLGNVIKTFCGLFSTQLKLFIEPSVEGGDCSFSNTNGSLLERFKQYIFGNTTSNTVQKIALIEVIWSITRYVLAGTSLILLLFARRYFLWFFFVGSIGYFSIITGHDGCGRYRIMFEPLLIMLASYALSLLYLKIKGMSYDTKKNGLGRQFASLFLSE